MINKSPGAFIALAVVLVLPLWICYGWRIEPESGQIAILLKTTGKDLPPEPSLVGGDAETAFELINRQMEGHGRGRLMMRELCCCIERNRYGSLNETIYQVKLGNYKDKE